MGGQLFSPTLFPFPLSSSFIFLYSFAFRFVPVVSLFFSSSVFLILMVCSANFLLTARQYKRRSLHLNLLFFVAFFESIFNRTKRILSTQ